MNLHDKDFKNLKMAYIVARSFMMTATNRKITAVLENSFGEDSDENVCGILVPADAASTLKTPRVREEANSSGLTPPHPNKNRKLGT